MVALRISHPTRPPGVSPGLLMLYKTLSAAVYGVNANVIEVEVDVSGIKQNEDRFHTVGLPDAAVARKPRPSASRAEKLWL